MTRTEPEESKDHNSAWPQSQVTQRSYCPSLLTGTEASLLPLTSTHGIAPSTDNTLSCHPQVLPFAQEVQLPTTFDSLALCVYMSICACMCLCVCVCPGCLCPCVYASAHVCARVYVCECVSDVSINYLPQLAPGTKLRPRGIEASFYETACWPLSLFSHGCLVGTWVLMLEKKTFLI